MEKIARNNPWPKPIAVYGYDDTLPIEGGTPFEAETTCVKEHNMGQIASRGLNGLSFWSRKPRINTPLPQNADSVSEPFNKSKTYMALVVGDGDNTFFLRESRRNWFEHRVARCKADASSKGCFPLLWTISPHILHLAPDWARWYFNQSYLTKHDYFVLPPSGDLYAYPSLMFDSDQAAFVKNTERDSTLLNTSGMVSWELSMTWVNAIKSYFPRYANDGIVRSAFAVNVPFNLPVAAFGLHQYYKVLGGKVVLFRPREWRGTSGGGVPLGKDTMISAKEMAAEINGYPKGTVSYIYMTSDGGAKLDDFYDLVQELDEHVQIVNHNAIANMALQAAAAEVVEKNAIVV